MCPLHYMPICHGKGSASCCRVLDYNVEVKFCIFTYNSSFIFWVKNMCYESIAEEIWVKLFKKKKIVLWFMMSTCQVRSKWTTTYLIFV